MTIDIGAEIASYFRSSEAKELFTTIIRDAVRAELADQLTSQLVDVAGAAEILNLSEAAVRKHAERGHLQPVRMGGRVLFRRIDLVLPAGR